MAETSNWAFDHTNENETPPGRCVRCGHTSESHNGSGTCGAHAGSCPCELSPLECQDRGWAVTPEPELNPLPLPDPVRLEALRLAVQRCAPAVHQDTVVVVAREFEAYLRGEK